MQTARMEQLHKLLRCPRCKKELVLYDTSGYCADCESTYRTRDDGAIPIYDLYLDPDFKEQGRDPGVSWDIDTFEQTYKFTGYHEAGSGFDKQLGFPEEVSQFLFERVKNRLLQWIEPGEGQCVLDVGCGAGYFLRLIHGRYHRLGFIPSLVGMDVSNFQLSYMVRRMAKEGIENITAVRGNGEYLPFADESFDLVTCSEVIEHIRNPVRALCEIHRVLKPGGTLLLSTPSMRAQKSWGYVLAPLAVIVKALTRYKPSPEKIVHAYEVPWYPKEFRRAILSANFRIRDFEYNAIIPHPWHFRFVSKRFVSPVVAVFRLVDRHLKFLFKPFALHFVARAYRGPGENSAAMKGSAVL